MKKLAVFAVAAVMAASAFADYGFFGDSTFSIGSYTGSGTEGNFAGWASEGNNQLGTLSDLTITAFAFNMWDESQSRGGGNLLLTLWDGSETPVGTADWHFGALTHTGGNDYSFAATESYDVLGAMGKTLEDNKTYYLDVQIHTYGGDPNVDMDLPKNSDGKFHTEFTYSASTPAVPEPATMSLLGLGALAMVLRRKLRK